MKEGIKIENKENINPQDEYLRREKVVFEYRKDARLWLKRIENSTWEYEVQKDIAIELARQGRLDEAEEWVEKIEDSDGKNITKTDITIELTKQGRLDEAEKLLEKIGDLYCWKSSAKKDIAIELTKQGKLDEAEEWVERIENSEIKNAAKKDIAIELTKQGKLDKAEEWIKRVEYSCWKDEDRKKIAIELTKQGKLDKAEEWIKRIEDLGIKNSIREDIAIELTRQGRLDEAEEWVEKIIGIYSRDYTRNYIAIELTKQGRLDEAEKWVWNIIEPNIKNWARAEIMLELAKQGKLAEAERWIERIKYSDVKDAAQRDVAIELTKQGRLDEAEEWVERIENSEIKNAAKKDIAIELTKQGKLDKAEEWIKRVEYSCWKDEDRKKIAIELAKQEKIKEMNEWFKKITVKDIKDETREKITVDLFKKSLQEEAEAEKIWNEHKLNPNSFRNIEEFIKNEGDAYVIGKLIREGKIKDIDLNTLNIPDVYKRVIELGKAGKEGKKAKEIVRETNTHRRIDARILSRSLSFAEMDSTEALWELWNKVQAKDASNASESSVRVARELVLENCNRGCPLVMKILQNPNLEAKRFIYLISLLIKEKYITKNLKEQMSVEKLPFIRTLIERYPDQFNTIIDSITKLKLNIADAQVQKDIMEGMEDMGTITHTIFKNYREKKTKEERRAFAERMKEVQEHFFENRNIKEIIEKKEEDILTEMVYMAYKPQNMSLQKVEELIHKVKDRTKDIEAYLGEKNGIYDLQLKETKYLLKEGERRNENLKEQLEKLLAMADGSPLEVGSEDMKVFSQTLRKLARGTFDLDKGEIATLSRVLGKVPLSHSLLTNDPYHAYTNLLEHFGIYAKDNYREALKSILEKDEKTKELFEQTIQNPKRRKILMNFIGMREDEKDISDTELISKAVRKIFQKNILSTLKKEMKKYERKEINTPLKRNLKLYISKNIGSFFAKSAAGICTAEDISLWNKENHFHMNMVENNDRVVGNIQAYIIKDPKGKEEKSLLLRGFNPTQEFLNSGISPESLVEAIFTIAKEFAESNEFSRIYITEQGGWHALSNRDQIYRALRRYMKHPVNHAVEVASHHTTLRIYEVVKLEETR